MIETYIKLYDWTRDMNVPLEERVVYSYIRHFAEESGTCTHSVSYIAATLGFKIATCRNAISHLSKIGAIRLEAERRILVDEGYANMMLGLPGGEADARSRAQSESMTGFNEHRAKSKRTPTPKDKIPSLMNEMTSRCASDESKRFVEKYLQPKARFTNTEKGEFIEKYINGDGSFPVDEVSEIIRNMKYDDFLYTPYWRSIAFHIKRKNNKTCQRCGASKERMEVHHTTYDNHGDELHHLNDLICLCERCHGEIHANTKQLWSL